MGHYHHDVVKSNSACKKITSTHSNYGHFIAEKKYIFDVFLSQTDMETDTSRLMESNQIDLYKNKNKKRKNVSPTSYQTTQIAV